MATTLLRMGAHIIGPNLSRAFSTCPSRKNTPKKNSCGIVSVAMNTSCRHSGAIDSARHSEELHRLITCGVKIVASTVTAASSRTNAVMIRLMKAWPPSSSWWVWRTIWGTSTVFSAPPANSM